MPQVHIANKPIFDYEDSHPARRFLEVLYEFRRDCAGRELVRPGREDTAVDLEWYSRSSKKLYRLSDVVYESFCFTPILSNWLENPDHITREETIMLDMIVHARRLFDEAEPVNQQDKNEAVAEIIRRGREVLDVWEQSIKLRISEINASGKIV